VERARFPKAILGECHVLAPACRTDLLVVRAVSKLITDAECCLNLLEIVDMHLACVGSSAAPTERLRPGGALILIKVDAQLRRALEDMEKLAEWKIEQREDDRHGMQLR